MHHLGLVHLLSQQETGLDHSSQHDVHSYYAVSETEADLRWASRIVYFHYVSFLAYPGSCIRLARRLFSLSSLQSQSYMPADSGI